MSCKIVQINKVIDRLENGASSKANVKALEDAKAYRNLLYEEKYIATVATLIVNKDVSSKEAIDTMLATDDVALALEAEVVKSEKASEEAYKAFQANKTLSQDSKSKVSTRKKGDRKEGKTALAKAENAIKINKY